LIHEISEATCTTQSAPARVFISVLSAVLHPARTGRDDDLFDTSANDELVTTGTTSDTIQQRRIFVHRHEGQIVHRWNWLTNPIGGTFVFNGPIGLEAQAVTVGPNPSGARVTIKRQDGEPFDLSSFSFNCWPIPRERGIAEVMPMLNGEDAFPDPFIYDATGYAADDFTNSTQQLSGFDSYKMSL
jgi:hypothetical protein